MYYLKPLVGMLLTEKNAWNMVKETCKEDVE